MLKVGPKFLTHIHAHCPSFKPVNAAFALNSLGSLGVIGCFMPFVILHLYQSNRMEDFSSTTPRRWPSMSVSACGPTRRCSACCLWALAGTRPRARTAPPTRASRPSSPTSSAAPQTQRVIRRQMFVRVMCKPQVRGSRHVLVFDFHG